jgi:hypothetical protein
MNTMIGLLVSGPSAEELKDLCLPNARRQEHDSRQREDKFGTGVLVGEARDDP